MKKYGKYGKYNRARGEEDDYYNCPHCAVNCTHCARCLNCASKCPKHWMKSRSHGLAIMCRIDACVYPCDFSHGAGPNLSKFKAKRAMATNSESIALVESHRHEEKAAKAGASNETSMTTTEAGASTSRGFGKKSFYRHLHYSDIHRPEDLQAVDVTPEDWNFPFENLVLEGGGCKGVAYAGLLRCLEKVGIADQLKRFAGASAGAMAATFMALGYTADEMEDLLSVDMESLFVDHKCGFLSLLSSIPRFFGWNPAKKFYNWLSGLIAAKSYTNNPAMTFDDLYKERSIELCIVVTNLNLNRATLCHAKTTPDMPIRDAVRMSMSIPIYFQACRYSTSGAQHKDIYVDGGVLNNYPLNCFDGWGLSMDPKNSFVKKLHPIENIGRILEKQFEGFNERTMGAILYADHERDVMRYNLEKRKGCDEPLKPEVETRLSKSKDTHMECYDQTMAGHTDKVEAMNKFLNACDTHEDGEVNYIGRNQIAGALAEMSVKHKLALFGDQHDVDSVIKYFDTTGNGKISMQEVLVSFDKHGAKVMENIYGFGRKEINGFLGFAKSIYESASLNLAMSNRTVDDEGRTIGINTGHVGTMDFQLEQADKDFALARGFNATNSFLQYFVVNNQRLVAKKYAASGMQEGSSYTLGGASAIIDSAFASIDSGSQKDGSSSGSSESKDGGSQN